MNIINAILNLSILFSGGGDLDTSKINGGGFVPAWAKEVVWYQIFPERFRNGDPSNDPKVEDTDGAYPHDITSPWEIHPWGSDWYKLRPYETENGKSIWFNIQRRRYGGDLQGIIDKLDYLQDLGITALYLNPVFTSPSLHKYDGVTFHHIDPNFGPDPEGDRRLTESEVFDDPSTWVWTSADKLALLLIEEAHKRGMKIIFDGVFNHMGIKSVPFEDVVKNQQKSRYADWFSVKSWDDPEKGSKFEYEGWFGVKELPEIKEDENGIVAGPKKYIFDITKRWMAPNGDPSKGIDGWRLDVAFCIQHKFWKDWRKEVKAINPEAYITAEVIDTISVVKEYLGGDEFDAVMNYNFGFAAADFIVAEKTRIPATAFAAMMEDLVTAFPGGVPYVQQNLFGSHDANRIGSHIVNRDLARYRYWGNYFNVSKGDNPSYNTRKPDAAEKQIQKLFVILQMTSVGAPMIY
ncbi:MAG: glycoside hydrolase family 13 protein, partial [Ignavibacteriaceae bacterium]|nr:glycoside hydrolase family 13 protein [Ignavibacteriaceae bacterium]